MSSHIALSKQKLACFAVDAVRANDSICCCGRAVAEVESHAAAFSVFDGLKALVEMSTSSRDSFDEFIEEMSAVYALHAAPVLLGSEHFAFMLALALIYEKSISNFQLYTKFSSAGCTRLHLRP